MARQRIIGKVQAVPKVWLSKKEVAAYLGVSERYITDNMDNDPQVEVYRLSQRCALYSKENIDRYVERSRITLG